MKKTYKSHRGKTIPYKDTHLTLENYKEPLREVRGGFGYYGTLLGTEDRKKLLCHVCGELVADLGKHVVNTHQLSRDTYRETYMLSKRTSLLSEEIRMKCKEAALKAWMAKTPQQREQLRRSKIAGWEKWRVTGYKQGYNSHRLEHKNKNGTCPDQLLDKVGQCALALGKTPTKIEFIDWCGNMRYIRLIETIFGWNNAKKKLGLENDPIRYAKKKPRRSDEELLEYLAIYRQENGKDPTTGDCKRGLLPSYQTYQARFGSLITARKKAYKMFHIDH